MNTFRRRLLQLLSNNFRNTTNWNCFVQNDSVPLCLIELESFLQNKIDVDPIYRILMFLPCFMHVLCMTWCIQVDRFRFRMIFVHGIHKQEEYCLSVGQMLTSKYSTRIDDELQIDCTSDMINVLEAARNNNIVL